MRARVAFDTLAYANKLKAAGVTSKIAEAQAEASADMVSGLLEDTIARKEDIKLEVDRLERQICESRVEISKTRSDLEKQILETRASLEKQISETRSDLENNILQTRSDLMQSIKELENKLTIRLGSIVIGSIGMGTAVLSILRIIH